MRSLLFSSTLVSLASAICHHGTALHAREEAKEAPKFGYVGEKGPVAWHTLDEAWGTCATGKNQSPINIEKGVEYLKEVSGRELDFKLDDQYTGAELENLGTTIEVKDAKGSIVRDGKAYSLVQYHFHTTSEHTFEDEAYSLEAHFVFQAEDESLSVVGIPIDVASYANVPSPFMTAVLEVADKIPKQGDHTKTHPLVAQEIADHIAQSTVYQYGGSLTTPPCTEGVAWNVVESPLYVLPSSYRKAKNVLRFNARFTQGVPGAENVLAVAATGLHAEY